MATPVIESTELAGSAPATLSIWHMISNADIVVMLVMLMLFLMSIWVWAMIIDKSLRLSRLNKRATQFEKAFWSGGTLDDLFERIGSRPRDPMSAIFAAAMREWRRVSARGIASSDAARLGLQQRIDRVMGVALDREMEAIESYMTMLASISSAAPFIGLFGTVWGIMNSFTAIAGSQNTSLAVVAPGIAEALFATALGLFAAIPAAVGYNRLSAMIGRYGNRLENFTNEFATILSRQLDDKAA